jgi:hypothetical protein
MKVLVYNLTDPDDKYGWFRKELIIKNTTDIEKLLGFCGNENCLYVTIVDPGNDNILLDEVNLLIENCYKTDVAKIIEILFYEVNDYREELIQQRMANYEANKSIS